MILPCGEWLIDPNDIEIVPGGGSVDIDDGDPFASTNDGARLGIDLVIAALSGGQTVTVRTTESGIDSQAGIIRLNAPLDIERTSGTNTLILDAHGPIDINEPIFDAAGGGELNLILDAGDADLFNTHGIRFNADVTLRGGSLTTDSDYVHVQNGSTMTLDGMHWQDNSRHVAISSGNGDSGTLVVQNGASVGAASYFNIAQEGGNGSLIVMGGSDVTVDRGIGIGDASRTSRGSVIVADAGSSLSTENNLNVGTDGSGVLIIRNGGETRARRVLIAHRADSVGTVTVTGSGSLLTTAGTDNEVLVGGRGTGTIEVLDGGLVDTRWFDLARWGAGRAVIRGVAEDGTRSRVIVSPVNGRSSDGPAEAGFARVTRNAGSIGHLEILEGGLLRVIDGDGTFGPGFQLGRNKGAVGTLLIDGEGSSLEVIQNGPAGEWGPYATLGRRGRGVATIRNGGRLLVRGEEASVEVSRDAVNPNYPDSDTGPINQRSEVNILSGGTIEVDGAQASFIIGNGGPAADGVVTVSGPGSTLVTRGTDNWVFVGDEGTGALYVLDGGLVDTLYLDVGRWGVGRLVIRGVASDGTRSRAIVSPAHGKFSGDFESLGGFARAGRNAGSHGFIEILDGGLLRVLDGNGTHGPQFDLARNKGSAGTLLIDGAGSSLEVIQDAPAVHGNPNVFPGPTVQLARRGGGTTTVRNGARLVVRGESAIARVSRDSSVSDPDPGPIDQRSVVHIESGGRMEVEGENASLVIGDSGPAADGEVVVTGPSTVLVLSGTGNRIVVGDDGGTGVLEAHDGSAVRYAELIVGENGTTNVSAPDEVRERADAVTGEVLPARDLATQEEGGDDQAPEEEEDDTVEDTAEEGGEAEEEELQPCPT